MNNTQEKKIHGSRKEIYRAEKAFIIRTTIILSIS